LCFLACLADVKYETRALEGPRYLLVRIQDQTLDEATVLTLSAAMLRNDLTYWTWLSGSISGMEHPGLFIKRRAQGSEVVISNLI
jgi:hypothetical protein